MIKYSEIYERFVNLVDDPQINKACMQNAIQFKKICYNFLMNGLSNFTSPVQVCDLLSEQQNPDGKMEVFDGTGVSKYTLTMQIPSGAEVMCFIAGKIDYDAVVANGEVTFSRSVSSGIKCAVEYYLDGQFTADFGKISGNMNKSSFNLRIIEILSRAMVIAWADKEQNFMLDIRNLLNDTDFKLHSPANALKSKREWVDGLRYEIYSLQNKLDWDFRNINKSYYGY